VEGIAKRGGTPLVVAEAPQQPTPGDLIVTRGTERAPARVLGVIHLKDIVKGGMKERFGELRRMGIKTVMITGDNQLTAAAIERVQNSIASHHAAGDEVSAARPLPLDLVLASGGGLDPDITIDAAHFQAPRVAQARRLPIERVSALIEAHAAGRMAHVTTGLPLTVNVLRLNIALAQLAAQQ
jgi:hypothetical protein